jgi:hypothetical protein
MTLDQFHPVAEETNTIYSITLQHAMYSHFHPPHISSQFPAHLRKYLTSSPSPEQTSQPEPPLPASKLAALGLAA